ncbi:hypothetical protein CMV_025210 [Castanea mollissima]|uniref:Uncharacterized protein n=1 Tax=Castanea mollissima TaxID=60419 RepID=A0A8J4Q9N5_9ROSI|nr:hypothetical protein CMV_025210 [Castanea mollissima]
MDLEYLIRSYDEVKHWKLKEVYFKSLLRTPEECQDLREEEDAVERHEDNVKKLLESLHHVKNLTVGIWCLTALSIMSVKHLPSPLSKCKCLTIQTSMGKCDLPGIGSLLQSSPYVETLVIDITSWGYVWPALVRDYDVVNHWKSKEIYFKVLLLRLNFWTNVMMK